jgi:Ca-activated chloride channel family protein
MVMFAGGLVRAQEPARLVTLNVVVRTRAGDIVRNLAAGDFTVDESGRSQALRSFARNADTALTIGLLIDTNAGQRRVIEQERKASYDFLERVLDKRRDGAFVMQFDSRADRARDATARRLLLTMCAVRCATGVERQELTAKPPGGFLIGSSETLYDAVASASRQRLGSKHGRRACILLSDGIDYGSEATLSAAIEAAQRANAPIYSIHSFDPLIRRIDRANPARALKQMSQATGGEYFEPSDTLTLERIYEQIEQALHFGYSLGIADSPGSGFRAVQVAVHGKDKRGDLIVEAPEGRFSESGGMPPSMGISSVDPLVARSGDLITATGDRLDPSNIVALYLTNGDRTMQAAMVEQTPNAVRFRVPENMAAGPWKEGERRRFQWSIVLETSSGDLLNYIAFGISID